MKFPIIAYSLIVANLFYYVQCLQCYESAGNISYIRQCSPKPEKQKMCFTATFGAENERLCLRGCSFETVYYGPYHFSLNCSNPECMDGMGCCCKGDLCNDRCLNEATTIRYSIFLTLLLSLMMFKFV